MASERIPDVSEEDVRRIALRDFGEAHVDVVLSILDEYRVKELDDPRPRVQAAYLKLVLRVRVDILKLANGDVDRLLQATQNAMGDYRDVIWPAEYPRYFREFSVRNKLPESSKQLEEDVKEDDWRQYCEWLERGRSEQQS